jgi:O-acetyl-ADP-ribose deacetylase (regulator of RNase III)
MPGELKANQSVVRLTTGFIVDLDVDAVVYYARPDLVLGSGFGGAIASKGGPKIQEELKKIGGINTTEAFITSGGNLKAKSITFRTALPPTLTLPLGGGRGGWG